MSETGIVLRHASDHSLLVTLAPEISPGAHRRVRNALAALMGEPLPGVTNLHPAYTSVLISYDPGVADREALRETVRDRIAAAERIELPEAPRVEIPVVYGGESGPDLGAVAERCGLAEQEVVRLHASGSYFVHFLGFSPGFPYLGGMPPEIAVPRRDTPRTRVPAGSVAIAGTQTGIYPLESPGGWQLIGRTPLALFDPHRTPPALLAIGDRVSFTPVTTADFGGLDDVAARPAGTVGRRAIRVLHGGFQSTVQDLGRPGHAHLGVSASGAADPFSLSVGNRLVGNGAGAAAVEMTLAGGTFAVEAATVIALAGSDFAPHLDDRPVPLWEAIEVRPGQTLAVGATRDGARCTLCVRGGVDAATVLGSRSTHLISGLGGLAGRALEDGDSLAVGEAAAGPGQRRGFDRARAAQALARTELRVVPGPQWERFAREARAALFSTPYRVSEDSSRMGLRLSGAPLAAAAQGGMITEGVTLGALQVPGDGQPILSFVEHQTTGGYPQIACVIAADLHRVGQLRPRDEVRFVGVTLAAADAARGELEAATRAVGVGE